MSTTERKIQKMPQDEKDIKPYPLAFFCKNCEKVIQAKQVGKKFAFRCPHCSKLDVAFGTTESVKNFYRIKD